MKQPNFKRLLKAVAGVGLLALGTSVAQAGFTTVNAPWPGELSQTEILQAVYGSGVVAVRLDDSTDQIWSGTVLSSRALARFSKFEHALAFDDGSGSVKQFDVTGNTLLVSGSAGSYSADSFSLVREGEGGTFSSIPGANSDGLDHLVSYLIDDGSKTVKTYALFFEDWASGSSDRDFNDLAVEVKTAGVPLPAAVWMGLSGLGVMGAVKRLRRQPA